jgi:hypothetical protein
MSHSRVSRRRGCCIPLAQPIALMVRGRTGQSLIRTEACQFAPDWTRNRAHQRSPTVKEPNQPRSRLRCSRPSPSQADDERARSPQVVVKWPLRPRATSRPRHSTVRADPEWGMVPDAEVPVSAWEPVEVARLPEPPRQRIDQPFRPSHRHQCAGRGPCHKRARTLGHRRHPTGQGRRSGRRSPPHRSSRSHHGPLIDLWS